MRILHVAEAFGGGLMEMVRIVSERAAHAGHDVGIAYGVRPETPVSLREEIPAPIELHPMPWTSRTPRAQALAVRALRTLVEEWRPDVVHLHSSFAGVIGAVAVGRRAPTVFSPHAYASAVPEGGAARRGVYRLAERFASRRATLVGAVSKSEGRFARERAGARRVEVIENGIPELDGDQPIVREPPAEARIVAMGRTVPQRQPIACARILEGVADVAQVAWIGGGGGERGIAGYQALETAGVTPTGWLSRTEVLAELGRASAYLHWTSWDGQPLSILEAMALDVVVVASDIEPNRDLLGGSQVRRTESDAVELLRRIVGEPDFAAGLRADQRARRRGYGADRMATEWLELYERIRLEAGGSP